MNQAVRDDEAIGTGRIIAYALGIWPTEIVSRATLRALLPKGENRKKGAISHARWIAGKTNTARTKNPVSYAFSDKLKSFEDRGWIQRGTEFVRVVDRRALFDLAVGGIHNPQHRKFLAIEDAAAKIAEEIALENRPKVIEIRCGELEFIKSLMQPEAYTGRDGRRRLVRQESGAITIPLGATTGIRKAASPIPVFPVIEVRHR